MTKNFLKTLGAVLVAAGLTFAGVVAPANAATGTLTVTTFTASTNTPAMTATMSSPSGSISDIRVQIQQMVGSYPYFTLKGSCPGTASATLSLCGVGTVKINSVDVSSASRVGNDGSGFLKISFTSAQAAGPVEIAFDAGAFIAGAGAGNYDFTMQARDSGMTGLGTYTQQVTVLGSNKTVTFNGNGADSGSMADQTTNIATPLTTNTFSKSGYSFGGWASSQANANAGTVYKADGASYPFAMSITLYAIWTPSGSGGGGSGSSGASTSSDTLANTGFNGMPYLATGAVLALAGAVIIMFARRRQDS